jgi:hypothetical protein
VLAAVGALDHDELRPTPVDARHVGRLESQHHQCCPVATAAPGRSPEAANALRKPNRKARPSGFEPKTFGSVAAPESALAPIPERSKRRCAAMGAATMSASCGTTGTSHCSSVEGAPVSTCAAAHHPPQELTGIRPECRVHANAEVLTDGARALSETRTGRPWSRPRYR